jgi:hypothetical protein
METSLLIFRARMIRMWKERGDMRGPVFKFFDEKIWGYHLFSGLTTVYFFGIKDKEH